MRRVHRDTREKDQFMSESFTALVKISNPVAKLLWRLNIPGVCNRHQNVLVRGYFFPEI
jgi:hypothetical protein